MNLGVGVRRLSNRELVARLAHAGPDDPQWVEFFDRFQPRVRLVVYRTVQTERQRYMRADTGEVRELVQELSQEVFVRLLDGERRALRRFQGASENSIYTYLHTIAVNLVRDHFKRLRAQKSPPRGASLEEPLPISATGGFPESSPLLRDALATTGASPEEEAAGSELRARIVSVVGRVSKGATSRRDRLIFRLYFEEGLTVDEIAACRSIGLSASGVEKCLRRLRRALRADLAEVQGGSAGENSSSKRS